MALIPTIWSVLWLLLAVLVPASLAGWLHSLPQFGGNAVSDKQSLKIKVGTGMNTLDRIFGWCLARSSDAFILHEKRVILVVVILVVGVGLWGWTQSAKPAPASTALPAKSISVPLAVKSDQPAAAPDKKPEAVTVVRPASSLVVANSTVGLTSVPSSRRVNADGLLLAEDLATPDGTVRIQKRYNYNADKILTRELEIRVSDGAITAVDYVVANDGKVQVRVTDEKGNVTIE